MKKLELFFTALRIPVDATMIVLAGWTAYWIRIHPIITNHLPVRFNINTGELSRVFLIVAAFWIILFAFNKLYSTKRQSLRTEIGHVILAISTGMMFVFTVIFFVREIFESRFIVLAAWILALVFVSIARLILRALQRFLVSRGYGQHRVVLIGTPDALAPLKAEFDQKPGLGLHVIGTRPHFDAETRSWILRKQRKGGVDELILANPDAKREEALAIVNFCDQNHINFLYTADLLEAATSRLQSHTHAGIPLFEVKRTPLDGWGSIYKRLFDIIGSAFLIVLTLVIQIPVAIILLLERQGGFLLYRRPDGKPFVRIGKGGKPFMFVKFRSMIKDAHKLRYDPAFLKKHDIEDTRKGSPLSKFKHDPRITPFGRFIRRTSIDEIPQFYLVLIGKMSLVGPRPHLPEEVAKYKPEHRKVLNVKPGITGMAQVSGRADLDFDDEVRLDTYYIENWSPWLDLNILLKTPWVVLTSKGAK